MQDISDPLYALINNGHMKESQTGIAVLDDIEVETFVGFCEYAYTGAYETPDLKSVSPPESPLDLQPNDSVNKFEDPIVNDEQTAVAYDGPEPEPEPELEPELEPEPEYVSPRFQRKNKKNKYGSYGRFEEDVESYSPPQINIVYPYELLWERFRSRKFNSEPASVSPNPDILFHAKLYIFATKYLIEPLRQQCLASMHRDLKRFSLNRENIYLIFDLVDFVYTHTGRAEAGGKSLLRDLVIHYVACEVRTLADDEKLSELLDSNAEVGSDLVLKLVR